MPIDISRSATDFRKHYTSVRAQMGRVLTDDDHNENERIHAEDERRMRVDAIGVAASPDEGFRIQNPVVTPKGIDFEIRAGAFYLGGNLLETAGETYQKQTDWLNMAPTDIQPLPTSHRFDLVYLECWQQTVSAIEDGELFEVALGGPDTTARVRQMHRVRIATGVTGDCVADFAALIAQKSAAGLGTLNDQNELVVDTALKVGFEAGPKGDLCSEAVVQGYLGAENQAIRVQLVDASTFTWGFDNATPLYRVTVGPDTQGQMRLVSMTTKPKDRAHWPATNLVVEFLAASALLPNGQKVAEVSGGLARVAAPYDSLAGTFTLDIEVAQGDYYLRAWDRGADISSATAIPFQVGQAVTLGDTGLNVTFIGKDYRSGDFWILAVRPDSPNRVVPWELETGRGPHGIRRYYVPLAEIEWSLSGGPAVGQIMHDCRIVFLPLSRIRTCCTYTVGDRVNTFGSYKSIQTAIDALPAAGGEVCILPGLYKENWRIVNRHGITVHGCGDRTVLMDNGDAKAPVVTIVDSQQIEIRGLAIEAPEVIAIGLSSTAAAEKNHLGLSGVDLKELTISSRDQSAIQCHGGHFIRMLRNQIEAASVEGRLSAVATTGRLPLVFVRGDDVLIEGNRLSVVSPRRRGRAAGGIQVGGGSERVEIRGNQILGSNGNGITLGSLHFVNQILGAISPSLITESVLPTLWTVTFRVDDAGCLLPDPNPQLPLGPNQIPQVPVSDGDLYDVRIDCNEITDAGFCGISTLRFFNPGFGPIVVHGLEIENNRITNYVALGLGSNPFGTGPEIGFGAVSLTAVEDFTLCHNRFERVSNHDDPVCGIFIRSVQGLIAADNVITDRVPPQQSKAGPRGGIIVGFVASPLGNDSYPAARISGNTIITSLGRALMLVARGPVVVEGNEFISRGLERSTNGAVVFIHNFGDSFESAGQFVGFTKMAKNLVHVISAAAVSASGATLFDDNQVLLFPPPAVVDPIDSVILLCTRGDGQMAGNQSECRTGPQRVVANAVVLGWSVRVNGNRFTENRASAGVSAHTSGVMNNTTSNQGTRCFTIVSPIGTPTVRDPNQSLIAQASTAACANLVAQLTGQLTALGFSA